MLWRCRGEYHIRFIYFCLNNNRLDARPVILGIRPAYLVDSVILFEDEIEELSDALQKRSSDLLILQLGEDFLVAHRNLLRDLLEDYIAGRYQVILIDFSSLKPCPSSTDESLKNLSNILVALLRDDATLVKIPYSAVSLPAIAGLLLSYPVVYHCDFEGELQNNAEVVVFSIYPSASKTKKLMQFSCPRDLSDGASEMLERTTANWEVRINQLSESRRREWREFAGTEDNNLHIESHAQTVAGMAL